MKLLNKKNLLSVQAIIVYLVAAKVIFHLVLPEYGYFRDELYYISIGDQFHFSNLDMLPLSPLYLRIFTLIFGYSIKTIHLASSLLGAGSLLLTCLITKELGGRKYAIFLSGLFFLFSGFLPFGSLFTYDSIDFLVIVSALYLMVKIIKNDDNKLWLYVGLVLGLGLMNKLTILFFGLAIFVSLWIVPQRKMFKYKQIWLAGIIALLFLTPYIIWQSQNNWYFLEFAKNYAGGYSYLASFPEFLWNQILPNNIAALPVWLTGLYLLIFSSKWKKYQLFGIIYLVLFILFFRIGVKFYFLVPMYTILLSVGSIKIEEKFGNLRKAAVAIPILYFVLSLPLLPIVVPILPVNNLVEYLGVLGVDAGIKYENNKLNVLPQYYADRFGWEEMVNEISKVYHSEKNYKISKTGIITNNWGIASAVHFYKDKYNLPETISNDGWYYFEMNKNVDSNKVFVSIGISESSLHYLFNSVTKKGIFTNQYCMPYKNNRPIYLCENPKVDLFQYSRVERRIDPEFISILRNKGIENGIEYYHKTISSNPKAILFTEGQINSLGYEYLQNNLIDEAILIFKLNIEVFPESFNVYDSLGEAFMKAQKYELAITNYKKSIELNPDNINGKNKLDELFKFLSK